MSIILMEIDRERGFQGYARYGIVRGEAKQVVLEVPEVLPSWEGVYVEVAGTCHLERDSGMMGVEQSFLVEHYPVKKWKYLEGIPLTLSRMDLREWCREALSGVPECVPERKASNGAYTVTSIGNGNTPWRMERA